MNVNLDIYAYTHAYMQKSLEADFLFITFIIDVKYLISNYFNNE